MVWWWPHEEKEVLPPAPSSREEKGEKIIEYKGQIITTHSLTEPQSPSMSMCLTQVKVTSKNIPCQATQMASAGTGDCWLLLQATTFACCLARITRHSSDGRVAVMLTAHGYSMLLSYVVKDSIGNRINRTRSYSFGT